MIEFAFFMATFVVGMILGIAAVNTYEFLRL
jgi:hypothetical protein